MKNSSGKWKKGILRYKRMLETSSLHRLHSSRAAPCSI
jgi:hypothetical protein